nr:hypothetical protein [Lachnospiraceae bacterium]
VKISEDTSKNSYAVNFVSKDDVKIKMTKTSGSATQKDGVYTVYAGSVVNVVNDNSKGIEKAHKTTLYFDGSETSSYFTLGTDDLTKKTITAKGESSSTIAIKYTVEFNDGQTADSNTLTVKVKSPAVQTKVTTEGLEEYVTQGYTMKFTAKALNGSTDLKWSVSEGGKYVESISGSTEVTIRFKEELDRGTDTGTVKLKCDVGGIYSTIDSDSSTEKTITVYSTPASAFDNATHDITYKLPERINTGTESGGDGDVTRTVIDKVKGVYVVVGANGSTVGNTKAFAIGGTVGTISGSNLDQISDNLNSLGKLSGDTVQVTYRLYPCRSDGTYNKKVYTESTTTLYKVRINYTENGVIRQKETYRFEPGGNTPVPDSEGIVIKAGSATGRAGNTVSVPVSISGNTGLGGLSLTVTWNPALTLTGIEKGSLLTKGTFESDINTGVVQWYTSNKAVKGDGVLFTLKFNINTGTENGSYTVNIDYTGGLKANITDENSVTLDVTLKPGDVSVNTVIKGDLTGDGDVAMGDVVKVARAVSGKVTLTDEEKTAADVTGDGDVAIGDVVKMARFVSGAIDEL